MSLKGLLIFGSAAALIFVSVSSQASTISLEGEVNKASVQKVIIKAQELASRGDRNITLSLNSGGGVLTEALRAYPILKSLGVNTFAHGDCSSSCTVLFAAGVHRSATSNTTFEFHQVGVAKKNAGLFGGGLDKDFVEKTRLDYASRWVNAVNGASPALAAELIKNRTLLKGRKVYRRGHLKALGYITD